MNDGDRTSTDGKPVASDESIDEERPLITGEHFQTKHDLGDDQILNALRQENANTGANVSPADMDVDIVHLFEQATEQTRMAMIISDPHRDDDPIIYVNQAFEEMTGYAREDIIGQNCRFLQGADNDPRAVRRIRDGLEAREVCVVELLNYRKDGTAFWNTLHVGPIFDEAGNVTHHYGSQWDVTQIVEARERHVFDARVAEELRHRTRNLFSVVSAIVQLSAVGADSAAELVGRAQERIRALSQAHDVSLGPDDASGDGVDLHTLVEAIMRPYRIGSGARMEISGPSVDLPPAKITSLGMTLHELATNAVKYGPLGKGAGSVRIEWRQDDERIVLTWRERHAEGADAPPDDVPAGSSGVGSKLMRGLIDGIDGTLETEMRPVGLEVTVALPLA